MATTVGRLCLRRLPAVSRLSARLFSDGKGRILSEEERAVENVYIQKMERERMEKLKKKKEKEAAAAAAEQAENDKKAHKAKTEYDRFTDAVKRVTRYEMLAENA